MTLWIQYGTLCMIIMIANTSKAMDFINNLDNDDEQREEIVGVCFFSDELPDLLATKNAVENCTMPGATIITEALLSQNLGFLLETSFVKNLANKTLSIEEFASIIYVALWEENQVEPHPRELLEENSTRTINQDRQEKIDAIFMNLLPEDFMQNVQLFRYTHRLNPAKITRAQPSRGVTKRHHPSKFTQNHENIINRYEIPDTTTLLEHCQKHLPQETTASNDSYTQNLLAITLDFFSGEETAPEEKPYTPDINTILELELMLQNFSSNNKIPMKLLDATMLEILPPITFAALISFRSHYYHQMDLLGYKEYKKLDA